MKKIYMVDVKIPTTDGREIVMQRYGERMPKAMVKIPAGAAKWRHLKYWYPDGRKPGLVIFVR